MKRVYAEAGFGNKEFLSTEIEEDNNENRVAGFILPEQVDDYYFRIWIFKVGLIISTKDGLKPFRKDRNKLKIIFGISGKSA
jgi:hypothetical protein